MKNKVKKGRAPFRKVYASVCDYDDEICISQIMGSEVKNIYLDIDQAESMLEVLEDLIVKIQDRAGQ